MLGNSHASDEAFDVLVLLHLDGCCEASQRQELERALSSDPERRARFARLACRHGQMRELLVSDHLLNVQVSAAKRRPAPRRSKPMWSGRHLIAAAALIAVAVTLLLVLRAAEAQHITAIAGSGNVFRQGHTQSVAPGSKLSAGDRIVVGGTDHLDLRCADGSVLLLSPSSVLILTTLDPASSGMTMRLERGLIEADVSPQPPEHPLMITTEQGQATIIGTHFTLSCDIQTARLAVEKGAVRFNERGGEPVIVYAGFVAIAHDGRPMAMHRIGIPDAPVPHEVGTGLKGDYYDSMEFQDYRFSRLDSEIDFNWGPNAPDPRIEPETFSIRWTGEIVARSSEEYTFWVTVDDGVRLWIDGKLLIDEWHRNEATEFSGRIRMEAGKHYPILLEYYQDPSLAQVSLSWSSKKVPKQIVPRTCLFPAP